MPAEVSASEGSDNDGDAEGIEQEAQVDAPFSAVLAKALDEADPPEVIYEDEVSPYRPVSTGDIFAGAQVEGVAAEEAPHEFVMVVAHPSAMRAGADLRPSLQAAPVLPVNGISAKKWTGGHYDVFPLPKFADTAASGGFTIEARGWAAKLDLAGPIRSAGLAIDRRVACLSPEGIQLLLQKLVHADTRVPVNVQTLAATFAPKLVELDMLYTWNEELIPGRIERDGRTLEEELRTAAEEFESVVDQPIGDSTIRRMLGEISAPGMAGRSGEAHRHFNAALNAQKEREVDLG